MSNPPSSPPNGHVGPLLSGYLDGELTQQQRQRVEVHCESCAECRDNLADLDALRERVGNARLSDTDPDTWREHMNDNLVQTSRGLGWLLLIGGVMLAAGWGIVAFITDPDVGAGEKVFVSAIYLGLAALFFSVLRQRLIERKTDKYEDVEI